MLVKRAPRDSAFSPDTEALSPECWELAKAKEVMQQARRFEFWYYQCVEEPKCHLILDHWPSVDSICESLFLVNQTKSCSASLKDQVHPWNRMFHLNIDQVQLHCH